LVAVPYGWLSNIFPELADSKRTQALFGQRSIHNRGIVDQVFPAWFLRGFRAVTGTGEITEEKITSLSIQAIQQMEAEAARARFEADEAEEAGDMEAALAH